jgi:hypothetical protein
MSTKRQGTAPGAEAFFQQKPGFRLEEFAHHLGSSRQKMLDRLKYHLRTVVTLERGLYAVDRAFICQKFEL